MRLYRVEVSYKVADSTYRRNRSINAVADSVIEAAEKTTDYAKNELGAVDEPQVWNVAHLGSLDIA